MTEQDDYPVALQDGRTRYAVLGAGAVGGVIGCALSRGGHEVVLIDPWPENVDAINAFGLTVEDPNGETHTVHPRAFHISDLASLKGRFDVVYLSLKSYDTRWAALLIEPHLAPGGCIVSAQNGINEESIGELVGRERVVGCVLLISAGMYEPGNVVRTGFASSNAFLVGETDGSETERAGRVVDSLAKMGSGSVTRNLIGHRWAKLAHNCFTNGVAGITGLASGELRMNPEVAEIGVHIIAEAVTVGRADGVEIGQVLGIPAALYTQAVGDQAAMEEVLASLAASAPTAVSGRPSLAQDLVKGRRTEIDFLNGYVATRGAKKNISTPLNARIAATVREIAARRLTQSIENLRFLDR
jgi:2-dehydropantoate 2-reductase